MIEAVAREIAIYLNKETHFNWEKYIFMTFSKQNLQITTLFLFVNRHSTITTVAKFSIWSISIQRASFYYVIHRFKCEKRKKIYEFDEFIYRWDNSATVITQTRSKYILWQFARQQPRYICHCSILLGLM